MEKFSQSVCQYMENEKIKYKDIKGIIFQCIIYCDLMNSYKINHNDLHLENILLDKEPFPIELENLSKKFKLNSKFRIIMIDFGLASIYGKKSVVSSEIICRNYHSAFNISSTQYFSYDILTFLGKMRIQAIKSNLPFNIKLLIDYLIMQIGNESGITGKESISD